MSKRPVFGERPPEPTRRRKSGKPTQEEISRRAHDAVAFSLRFDEAGAPESAAPLTCQPMPQLEATPTAASEPAGAAEDSATAMVGQERTVQIAEIRPPDAVHSVVRPKLLNALQDAIRTVGSRRLIEVRELAAPGEDGGHRYEIVTGAAEYMAHKALGSRELRVRVVTCSDVQAEQSRIAEGIRDAGPDMWRRIVDVVRLRAAIAAECGCAASDVLQKDVASGAPGLEEGLVSLCCSAHRAMVEAGVDLDDEKLHDISRERFRLISRAEGDPARVRDLVATATSRKAARGKALAKEMGERFGEIVTVDETEEGPRISVRHGVPPEDVPALIRYAAGMLRRALSDWARRSQQ